MRVGRIVAAALVIAAAAGVAPAQEFTNTVFFGDSLSDAGSFAGFLPPGTGRFTTNPGPVWTEVLAARLGFSATPAVNGGTNYAEGGARITGLPGIPPSFPLTAAATPIAQQVANYLAATGGRADSGALYSLWGGANDLFWLAGLPPDQQGAYVVVTTSEEVAAIQRLAEAGARYILVPNLPDIGLTPYGFSLGPGAAQATAAAAGYNTLLYAGLRRAGLKVIPADIFTLLREANAAPSKYGFSNVTDPACGATGSLFCTAASLVAPDAARTYLFADSVHPTTAGHEFLADYMYGMIEAPFQMGLLGETSARSGAAGIRNLYEQMQLVPGDAGRRAWVTVSGLWPDLEGADTSGMPVSVAFGLDGPASDSLRFGVSGGVGRFNADFAHGGEYKMTELSATIYARVTNGGWHAFFGGAAAMQEFDTERHVEIGPAIRRLAGDTTGARVSGLFQFGYEWERGALRHGPFAGWLWQDLSVNDFTERTAPNDLSSALRFDTQSRRTSNVNLGWQASYTVGSFDLFGRAAWNKATNRDDVRVVSAELVSTTSPSFELPLPAVDVNSGDLTLGAQFPLGGAKGWIFAGRTIEASEGDETRLQFGVSFGF